MEETGILENPIFPPDCYLVLNQVADSGGRLPQHSVLVAVVKKA
jgi:hypothetical protein